MLKKIVKAVAVTAIAGGSVLVGAGGASAAHCFEGDSPGFSYFGQEGREKNVPSPGASTCSDKANGADPSPSTRAPGQNRGG